MDDRDLEGRTPAEERAEIGTPAGESPITGRQRHGTELLHPEIAEEDVEPESRKIVADDMTDEDFALEGEEISSTGGLTGTHVKGGTSAGGSAAGGTPGEAEEFRSGDHKS